MATKIDPIEKTLRLLKDSQLQKERIAVETGTTCSWLYLFQRGGMADPGYKKVKRLYEYLSGRKLEV